MKKDDLAMIATFILTVFMAAFSVAGIYRLWSMYFNPDYYREISLAPAIGATMLFVVFFAASMIGVICSFRELRR